MTDSSNVHLRNVTVARTEYLDAYCGWIRGIDPATGDGFAASLTWHPVEPGQMVEATVRMTDEQAQYLLDCLWGAGLRPSWVSTGFDVIDAQRDHIQSLRRSQDALHSLIEGTRISTLRREPR